ncbi:MAG: hypothetical protein Q7T89_01500 [Anaerolineales bacterium]|nr:hypothetical protein [Anaerolineales bacterium]
MDHNENGIKTASALICADAVLIDSPYAYCPEGVVLTVRLSLTVSKGFP